MTLLIEDPLEYECTRRWPMQARVVKMSGKNCHTDKNTKMIHSNTWMMRIWRNTYNIELNWDVFVLRHSRRYFSHIWDSTSMCRLTEEVDGPMIGFLCHRHFVGFLLCQSWHRHGTTLFPLILKNRTLLSSSGIHQMIDIVIEEIHVNAALAWSRISTSRPLLRNWYYACLVLGRSIIRATLYASH